MENNIPEAVSKRKQYNKKDKEKNRERSRQYYQDNKERLQKLC